MTQTTPTALITGASRGLGAALATALPERGWHLILTARGAQALAQTAQRLPGTYQLLPGDVTDPAHRADLARAVQTLGRLDALFLNASHLGPSPQPALTAYPESALARVFDVNVLAPLATVAALEPWIPEGGCVFGISSDAAREAYPGWGGYGASKAALDHALAILGAERPDWRVLTVDPGDMRTQMHAEAFPGQDLSHLPLPEASVPGLLRLLTTPNLASGRYHARDAQEAAS